MYNNDRRTTNNKYYWRLDSLMWDMPGVTNQKSLVSLYTSWHLMVCGRRLPGYCQCYLWDSSRLPPRTSRRPQNLQTPQIRQLDPPPNWQEASSSLIFMYRYCWIEIIFFPTIKHSNQSERISRSIIIHKCVWCFLCIVFNMKFYVNYHIIRSFLISQI